MIKNAVGKVLFVTLLIKSCAFSESFVPPKNMTLFGKQYSLVFKNENTENALYEYTTDNEPVENWTRLITLIDYKFKMNTYQFLTATQQGVEKQLHTSKYSLFQKEDNGYALLIYAPSREHLNYEADIQKSFHIDKCDGTIKLQYGIRKPAFQQLSKQENQDTIKALMEQLERDSQQIAEDQWRPICE